MALFFKGRGSKLFAFALSTACVGIFFQNCAKPGLEVVDLEEIAKALEAERIAIGADEEVVTVGLNGVPDLKMFFVVDNSGTMKENQLNLSESFGAMFDKNSASSLTKFDTTAYLFSTAQRSPSLASEKGLLEQIGEKQKTFSLSSAFSSADYASLYRSNTQNSGVVPGDNLGFNLLKSAVAPQYQFKIAPVLGVEAQADGSGKWQSAIRKPASADPEQMQNGFKERLKVLDSERIPLVLQSNGKYAPENASIVDAESGLCAVARVLRNPESYIKSGDLFSFVIVSDENDNDPAGQSCVQSYKEFTGNEDLVDGECRRNETTISFKPAIVSTSASTCNINGQKGYNYMVSYPNTHYTTTVNYRALTSKPEYMVSTTSLTYKVKSTTYEYLNTTVKYYVETCVDVVSDGLVVGKKCTVSATPSTNSRAGNFTSDCYAFAKSFNAGAVNTTDKMPVCTTAYVAVGSACSLADANCKATDKFNDKVVSNLLGTLSDADCLAKAKSYSDFAAGTTPICVGTTRKVVGACTAEEMTAGCTLSKAAVYATKTVTAANDLTGVQDGCKNYAQAQLDQAIRAENPEDISCVVSTINETLSVTGQIAFAETAAADGGTTLANGDCGSIKSLIMPKAKSMKSQITENDVCQITGAYAAAQKTVNLDTDCQTQAKAYCDANSQRACTSALVAGTSSTTYGAAQAYNKVSELLSCNSLCQDSKLGVCGSDSLPGQTIAQHLQQVKGAGTQCVASVANIASGALKQTAVLLADEGKVCKPTFEGIPTYFTRLKGPYRTTSSDVDYVAGSIKGSDGVSRPAMGLVDYIKARSAELSQIQPIITVIVRTPNDTLGNGGSAGLEYLKLVNNGQTGQVESVLSKDYSVALKDLSRIVKEKMERSFVLKKMQAHQIITKVFLVPKGSNGPGVELPQSKWIQSGATLNMTKDLEFNEGDQFRVEFQNYIKN